MAIKKGDMTDHRSSSHINRPYRVCRKEEDSMADKTSDATKPKKKRLSKGERKHVRRMKAEARNPKAVHK